LEFTDYQGKTKSTPLTVADIARRQEKEVKAFAPMAGDLTFIRHDIPIAEGFSGSPVVSLRDGKVVGVQSSTLKDAAFVGFAVHRQHIHKFDWKTPARDLKDPILTSVDTVLARKSAQAVPYRPNPIATAPKEPPPVKITLGGIEVEAPFVHHGYIEKDAFKVLEKYIEDQDWYLSEQFSGRRLKHLQDLLDRTSVARISNPLLGFEVLVPKGYRYSVLPTDKGGVLLALYDGEGDPFADGPHMVGQSGGHCWGS
jgi:hypothetical protein